MSVIPTKPGDRMAASAWETRKADQNAGAGNAFAEMFGAAWTQQMQQTRAVQDQRMVSDNGAPAIAETSRRAEDGMAREQSASARMPSREPQRSSDSQRSDEPNVDQGMEQTRASENRQAGKDANDAKRQADNAGSDAALAKRMARQQRPASQNGQAAQMPRTAQELSGRAGSSAIAEDTVDALTAAAKGKGKRSPAADNASGAAGVDGADGSLAKTAGNDAVQTQRAVIAAEASGSTDAAVTATVANLPDAATGSSNQADSTNDLLAASTRTGKVPADAQAAAAVRTGSLNTAETSGKQLPSATEAALRTATPASSVDGLQDAAGLSSTDPAATQGDAQSVTDKLQNLRAPGTAAVASASAGNSKDAAVRMASAADLAQTAAAANTTTPGSNTVSPTDALRQRAGTAEATLPQTKAIDARDASALSMQSASADSAGAKPTPNNGTATAGLTGADRSAASSASTLPAVNASGKADDSRPAQSARNRTGTGLNAVSTTAGTNAGSSLSAVATDTRVAVEQAAAANAGNNLQGNTAQAAASLQGTTGSSSLASPTATERVSDNAANASGAGSGNGSQLTAAALDGLNAFQRVAAQDDTPRLVMSTPITEPGFADELYDTVKLVSTRGLQSVEINIAPAELGPIKLRVDMTGNEAEVRFEAAQEATRNLLTDAVPALKEQLAQSGIDLRHASIDRNNAWNGNPQNPGQNLGQGAGQSGNSGGQQSGQGGQSGSRLDSNSGNSRGDAGIQQPAQRLRNALLDTYA